MEKRKTYERTKFKQQVLRRAISACDNATAEGQVSYFLHRIHNGSESWTFDEIDEFFSSYSSDGVHEAILTYNRRENNSSSLDFDVFFVGGNTVVSVKATSRAKIENVFSVFEEAGGEELIIRERSRPKPAIFIGHGHNRQWELLKAHLQDKHSLNIIAYETGARAGHAIRDVLDSMARESSLALLVLIGEDQTSEGLRARQNVIHECGLFQGRLGFDRAILLVEDGVELASNFDGIQQLRFEKGRIAETFGDVLATIRREFGPI